MSSGRPPRACMGRLCTPAPALRGREAAAGDPAPPAIVGIDLAWGTRNPTGIAVLTASGELRSIASVRSDEEIDDAIAAWISGPCVVALDAPLHVVNPTGRRPCEAALTRAFAPQHAGTYPSNTGLAHFAGGAVLRRWRAATGWTLTRPCPPGPGQRRALEVYPHSAAVALFDLDRVLAYKARKGRTATTRQAALGRLVELLSGLAGATGLPRLAGDDIFASLRRQLAAARTGAALRRLEDPVDAILCAYVGSLFLAGRTCVIGDSETGAIVTPVQERHRVLLGLPPCPAHSGDPACAPSQICCGDSGSR